MEDLEVDISNLKDAYDCIVSAMNNIKDYDDLDEYYKMLDDTAKEIKHMIMYVEDEISKEREIEEAREEIQMQQWEREDKQLEREYWKSQF